MNTEEPESSFLTTWQSKTGDVLISVPTRENLTVVILCNVPAPLVVNGVMYVGCGLAKGHKGKYHETTVRWIQ